MANIEFDLAVVRDGFECFLLDTAQSIGMEIELLTLPDPLHTWRKQSDEEFAKSMLQKLGPYRDFLLSTPGTEMLIGKMIESSAIEQADFSTLLIAIRENPVQLAIFGSYLSVILTCAQKKLGIAF